MDRMIIVAAIAFCCCIVDSVTYWRNYWATRLESEVGKTEFWNKKAIYDDIIEQWINCYVFSDTMFILDPVDQIKCVQDV